MKVFRSEGGKVKTDEEKRQMAEKHRFKKNREFKQRLEEQEENEEADIRSFTFHRHDLEKPRKSGYSEKSGRSGRGGYSDRSERGGRGGYSDKQGFSGRQGKPGKPSRNTRPDKRSFGGKKRNSNRFDNDDED
jgi:putative N6-adenine-specific DNA methylase